MVRVRGPASALEVASRHAADGVNVKLVTCGGLRCARQMDAIARAAEDARVDLGGKPVSLFLLGLIAGAVAVRLPRTVH